MLKTVKDWTKMTIDLYPKKQSSAEWCLTYVKKFE